MAHDLHHPGRPAPHRGREPLRPQVPALVRDAEHQVRPPHRPLPPVAQRAQVQEYDPRHPLARPGPLDRLPGPPHPADAVPRGQVLGQGKKNPARRGVCFSPSRCVGAIPRSFKRPIWRSHSSRTCPKSTRPRTYRRNSSLKLPRNRPCGPMSVGNLPGPPPRARRAGCSDARPRPSGPRAPPPGPRPGTARLARAVCGGHGPCRAQLRHRPAHGRVQAQVVHVDDHLHARVHPPDGPQKSRVFPLLECCRSVACVPVRRGGSASGGQGGAPPLEPPFRVAP